MSDAPWEQTHETDNEFLHGLRVEHGEALWRYALSLTGGDPVQAEDVVQETMFRAWQHPQAFRPGHGSARAWLYTVARHVITDERRSAHSRHETTTDQVPDRPGPDFGDQVVDRHLVAKALRQLTPDHQAVLRECYFRGSSVADAAETLGITPGTVKSRTHYALEALRRAIEELGGVE